MEGLIRRLAADSADPTLIGKHLIEFRYPDFVQLPEIATGVAEWILLPVTPLFPPWIYVPNRWLQ
jgi:hypothetical protein